MRKILVHFIVFLFLVLKFEKCAVLKLIKITVPSKTFVHEQHIQYCSTTVQYLVQYCTKVLYTTTAFTS